MSVLIPLKHAVDAARPITYGIVQAGEDYPDGVPYIRPVDMQQSAGVLDRDGLRRTSPAIASAYRRSTVRAGDLVVTIGPSFGKVMVVPEELTGANLTQGTARVAPAAGVDGRYLYWALQTRPVDAFWEGAVGGATFRALNLGPLSNTPIHMHPLGEQQTIADYLDQETARMDALIGKLERLIELTKERWQGLLETRIRKLSDSWGDVPLKYACTEIVVGIVVTPSAWYAESGVVALRGVNITPGEIRLDDVVYLTEEGHALHHKSRLSVGDVVIVRTGQAGAAAVVPPALKGANCVDLVIARPRADLRPHFLEYVLNSDWMQKHIEKNSVGTIQSHFNVGAAKKAPIPMAPLPEQDRTVDDLRRARTFATAITEKSSRQVSVLKERRLALITAAVTGQLDVSEAG